MNIHLFIGIGALLTVTLSGGCRQVRSWLDTESAPPAAAAKNAPSAPTAPKAAAKPPAADSAGELGVAAELNDVERAYLKDIHEKNRRSGAAAQKQVFGGFLRGN